MTDTKTKEPAVGDLVPMPADEAVAAHIEAIVGPRGDAVRLVPFTADMQKEQKSAKSCDSPDVQVVDKDAGPAPAGYDKFGQPLKSEDERRNPTATATGICLTCKHSSSEHPGGKACTHTTATLECDCAAFVAPN